MQSEYEKLITKYKLSKIFPKAIIITKNAKLKLNELSLLISSYVLLILKNTKKPNSIIKEDIDSIINTLK